MNKFNKYPRSKSGPQSNRAPKPHGPGPGRGKSKKKKVRRNPVPSAPKPIDYEDTGMEAGYMKELVDRETSVVVVMRTGEELRGIVRYYDREVFSLGPVDGSPKLFLRKESIRYLYEEPPVKRKTA